MQLGYLFTNLLAAIAVTYGWINPFIGLMIYYAFAILRPTQLWFWVSWPLHRYSFYAGMATLIGWFMSGLGDFSGLRKISFPLWCFATYLLCGVLTWRLASPYPPRSWIYLYPQLIIGLMMLVTVSLIRNEKQIKAFAWVTMLSMGYLGWNFNLQYLDNPFYLRLRGFGGIDNNGVAMSMVMGVPIAFMMGVNTRNVLAKAVCYLSVATLTHVVLFSGSRGGMLGLCMVGAALFVIALVGLPNKIRTIFMAGVMTAVALHLAGEGVRQRFFSIFLDQDELDASAASRFSTWAGAWACMKEHPFGMGPRGFNLVSHLYGLPGNKSVHNLFLQTGADYGFIGMFALMGFYMGTAVITFMMSMSATARRLVWPRYFGHMVTVSISGMLVCSIFIGMESVETGFIISLVGLCTVAHVDRVSQGVTEQGALPELVEVPSAEEFADLVPA